MRSGPVLASALERLCGGRAQRVFTPMGKTLERGLESAVPCQTRLDDGHSDVVDDIVVGRAVHSAKRVDHHLRIVRQPDRTASDGKRKLWFFQAGGEVV